MSLENFSNNAITSLTASITAGQTTITVASNSGFPQSGQFRIVVDAEIMLVTAGYAGLTWTVVRASESTTGATHANNAVVAHGVTAGSLLNLGPSGSFTSISTGTVAANFNAGGITVGRYLGSTAGVAPTGGPYNTGDWTFDGTYPGVRWLCTAGGSPGTWKATGTGAYASAYYNGAGQPNANSTFVNVALDTAIDNYSLLSNAFGGLGAKSTYTCPLSGTISASGAVQLAVAAYQDGVLAIYKNGVEYKRGQRPAYQPAVINIGLTVSTTIDVAAGDYLQFFVYQSSGASRNTTAGSSLTWASFQFVGAQ